MEKEVFKLKEKEYAQIPILIFAIVLIIPTIGILSEGIYAKVSYLSLIGELVNAIKGLTSGSKGNYHLDLAAMVKTQGVFQLLNLLAIIVVDVLAFFMERKGKKTGFLFSILGILAIFALDDKWFDFWTFCSLVILVCSWGINIVRRIDRKANKRAKQELKRDTK